MMGKQDRAELVLIALTTGVLALLSSTFPKRIGMGQFIISITLLFLVQNLIRDLWMLRVKKN